jgi:hypothetical protein
MELLVEKALDLGFTFDDIRDVLEKVLAYPVWD